MYKQNKIFCARECSNMQCEHNIKHIDNVDKSIYIAEFNKCKEYKEMEEK